MRFYRLALILIAVLPVCFDFAWAQVPPAEVIRRNEQIQRRQQDNLDDRRQRIIEQQDQGISGVQPQPLSEQDGEKNACIDVVSIKLEGITVYNPSRFDGQIAQIVGRCASLHEINTLVREVTNTYIDDGYITTRAFIRPDGVGEGALHVAVLEGRVEEVSGFEGSTFGNARLVTAFPFIEGGLLNLRDLEQGIDQLNRLASIDATLDIQPGEVAGASHVVVKHKTIGRPYRFTLNVDNNGQQSTGRVVHTAGLEVDSPFGLNDFWSVYYSRDARYSKVTGTEAFGGFFSLPFGHTTLSISGGKSNYDSVITGSFENFASKGSSWNILGEIDQVLFRDGKTKISAAPFIQIFNAENFIEDVRLLSSSYRLSILGARLKGQRTVLGGILSGQAEAQWGANILGAEAVDLGPESPDTEFTSVAFTTSFFKPLELFGFKFRYNTLLRGEWNFDAVFPVIRISLGGPATVRGFRDDGISGRRGLFNRHEISKDLLEFGGEGVLPTTQILGYLGYDWGGILANNDDPFERGVLHSTTFGLRTLGGPFFLDLGVSVPISSPQFVEHRDVEVSASLRLTF
ncbi:MAG: ShlB/FhaC/HecB family hemolysin secretion/activation protein [Sphingomonadales bacterium]